MHWFSRGPVYPVGVARGHLVWREIIKSLVVFRVQENVTDETLHVFSFRNQLVGAVLEEVVGFLN